MVMEVMEVAEKAWEPMLSRLLGNVIEVKLVQLAKADSSIVTTLFGIVIEVRLQQFMKAFSPIVVTPSGMMNSIISFSLLSIS